MEDDVKKARESGFIAHLTKPIVVRRVRATIGEIPPDVLTIHEAEPGHYIQLAYSNRHPSLIRRVLSSGTFYEGWAGLTQLSQE